MSRPVRRTAAALLGLAAALALAPALAHADAAELRARHAQLREALLQPNGFGRPLHIDSEERPDALHGTVHAILDHRYATVSAALREPAAWCDILILPFNTKYCRAEQAGEGPMLQVRIGRRPEQPVEEAYRLQFAWHLVAARPDYFEVRLAAPTGPVGTRDYRITVAAVPLEDGRTFLQLDYRYGFGALGRMAMRMYLATSGANKVGFTVVGRDAGGQPQYIQGVRGVVERNTMRHYLAIDAYLDALSVPPQQRVERRIQQWFSATERYPRQLREMDRDTYVRMKRQEYERQQSALP